MSCPICGAPLAKPTAVWDAALERYQKPKSEEPFCSAVFSHTTKRRTDADLECRREDLQILKAARELAGIVRAATKCEVGMIGVTAISLGLVRLLASIDRADPGGAPADETAQGHPS